MANSTIRITGDARGLATVTLNRPEVHNAFNETLIAELTAALGELAADERVRAVILAGEGPSFCAGADLDWMRRTGVYTREENFADARGAAEMLRALDTLPKPTIAMVRGPAFGGGAGLIACCDIAVASESAVFSFSEVRLGLIPAVISPYVIAAIGARQARRYFLTAERFPAAEARRIGLVHEVTAAESLAAAVEAVASEIQSGGPQALRAAKDLIRAVASNPGGENLPAETARRIAEIRAGDEAREGIQAFLEKRTAPWKQNSPDA
jgi:methylglutaconyl-CoA hydratase